MSSVIKDYLDALERLKRNSPKIVAKDTLINKDTVALEAGRKRGSIKKSRGVFRDLITAIEVESKRQNDKRNQPRQRIRKLVSDVDELKKLYEQSLARELSLVRQVRQLKDEILELKKAKPTSVS